MTAISRLIAVFTTTNVTETPLVISDQIRAIAEEWAAVKPGCTVERCC